MISPHHCMSDRLEGGPGVEMWECFVLVWPEIPGGTHLSPVSLPQTSPWSKSMLRLDQPLWFLLQSQDTLQQQPSGNSENKKDLSLQGPGNYMTHLGPHSEVTGTERTQAWGSVHQGGGR